MKTRSWRVPVHSLWVRSRQSHLSHLWVETLAQSASLNKVQDASMAASPLTSCRCEREPCKTQQPNHSEWQTEHVSCDVAVRKLSVLHTLFECFSIFFLSEFFAKSWTGILPVCSLRFTLRFGYFGLRLTPFHFSPWKITTLFKWRHTEDVAQHLVTDLHPWSQYRPLTCCLRCVCCCSFRSATSLFA